MKEFRSEYNVRVQRESVLRGTPGERCIVLFIYFFIFIFVIIVIFFLLFVCSKWKYHNNYYCYKPFPAREKRPERPVVPLCVGLINNYYSDKFTRRSVDGGDDGIWALNFPGVSCLKVKSFTAESQCTKSRGTMCTHIQLRVYILCCCRDDNNYLKQNKTKKYSKK